MRVNPHIERAIEQHRADGMEFHDLVSWHMLHGIVMVTPSFLLLGYYCRHDAPHLAKGIGESDCGYVTYMTGDPVAAAKMCGYGIDFIAFRRGFKNFKPSQVYPMDRVAKLLKHQQKKSHGRRRITRGT